jgi:adenylylsulfate kinase
MVDLPEFTGISSPYKLPMKPELILDTGNSELEVCVNTVLGEMTRRGIVNAIP